MHGAFAPACGRGETKKPCMFHDVFDLTQGMAYCTTHKRSCKVPSCCVFVCRVECQDFAAAVPQGFKQIIRYVEAARPSIFILEKLSFNNSCPVRYP